MAPGVRSKFGALMFASEVFRKQMYSIEESAWDISVPGKFGLVAPLSCLS